MVPLVDTKAGVNASEFGSSNHQGGTSDGSDAFAYVPSQREVPNVSWSQSVPPAAEGGATRSKSAGSGSDRASIVVRCAAEGCRFRCQQGASVRTRIVMNAAL